MKDRFLNLTSVLSRLRRDQKDSLENLPDRIAAILELYSRPGLNEAKQSDIFNLINGALSLAEALATDTYPGPVGVRWATYNIQILTRVINHLEDRPSISRFGLLCIETGELHSEVYGTPEEALASLNALRRFGVTRTFEIVPVTLTSGHVVQPGTGGPGQVAPVDHDPVEEPPPETQTEGDPAAEAHLDTPIIIPRGIVPA